MRTRTISILFVILVTVCLTAVSALAADTTGFESSGDLNAVAAPVINVTTSGTTVSLSWTSVPGATGYTLSYAPYPYTGPDSIGNIPMGTQTSMSASLWDGAAFFVALQAYDSLETLGIPISSSLPSTVAGQIGPLLKTMSPWGLLVYLQRPSCWMTVRSAFTSQGDFRE